MPSTLTDDELTSLLDSTVAATEEQLTAIKKANEQIEQLTAERDSWQARATNAESALSSKAASSAALPMDLCMEIAESLSARGLLGRSKQAAFAANISKDTGLLKLAFEQIASRVPFTVEPQGSALIDKSAHFQAAAATSKDTPWM